MKKVLLVCFIVLIAGTVAFGSEYTGVLNNAPYKVRVPENWNGELLLYAHGYGYLERWNPATQFDYSYADAAPGGAAMEDFLLSQGYALAGTVFSGTGWQVKEGTHELVSLAGLFNGLVGKPKRTVLIGYSMGSLIALKSAEEVPVYDGIITGCTAGAGSPIGVDFIGAFAMAYSTLFGWPADWGTWYDVRNDLNFNTEVVPVLMGQLSDPVNIGKFEFMRVLFDIPSEGFYQNPGWLFLQMFLATQARGEIEMRAKGPVVQNVDHVYLLSDADKAYLMAIGFPAGQIDYLLAALNAQTTVTVAQPQRHYMEKYFGPSGDIQRPVISIHEIGDGFVGVQHETVLRDTVTAAGKEGLFVQAFTGGTWHCGFTAPQLLTTIKAMDFWLDTGMKPGADFFPAASGFVPGYVPPAWPIGTK